MPRALRYWSSNMVDVFERLNNVGISWNVDYDTYVILYIEYYILKFQLFRMIIMDDLNMEWNYAFKL